MNTQRILYLEDDENDVTLLRETFAGAGLAVELVHVRTPWDFSAALKSRVPNLILFDAKVAGFGGLAALHMARAACPEVPSFCLTGLVTEEKAAEMHEAGAAGCLSKQDWAEAVATIRQVLKDRPAGEPANP